MTGTTSPSPLIDRYIYDVVRRLPKDQREDIELELRALIDDMLGGAAEESEVAGVLQNLGKPADLAEPPAAVNIFVCSHAISPFSLYACICSKPCYFNT